ncbi:MAG: CcoQ/FixQ family Cbb3-type cytochrome c oxidase assembly chaperone [Gammaproteobacteria bacterium]|nr:CcoQ/FixQ family Cbb3-type cytochrome c oxidase assembly chaperone [Gammaproteobacteria bacterium]
MSLILSIWTVVAFLMFLAICLWAWSSANKNEFDAAAHIPFDEDDSMETPKENHHG